MYTQQQLATAFTKSRSESIATRGAVAWDSMTTFNIFAMGYHAAHYEQKFVHTAVELDNLFEGVVIVTEQGGVYIAENEEVTEGSDNGLTIRVWHETGTANTQFSDDLALPARIIGNANDEWTI